MASDDAAARVPMAGTAPTTAAGMTQVSTAAVVGEAQPAVAPASSFGLALVQALIAVFLWASSHTAVKFFLTDLPPLTYTALRQFFAAAALVIITRWVLRRRRSIDFRRVPWILLTIVGLGQGFGSIGAFIALGHAPVATVSFFQNVFPLFVALLGILFLHEIPTWVQGIGIAIVLVGTYLFFPTQPEPAIVVGALWVLAGQLGWTTSVLVSRGLLSRGAMAADDVSTLSTCLTSAALAVGALATDGVPRVGVDDILVLAGLGAVCTGVASIFWMRALRSLPAFQTSVISNLQPLFGGGTAYLALAEPLPLHKIAGMITVLVGVVVVQWHDKLPWTRGRRRVTR